MEVFLVSSYLLSAAVNVFPNKALFALNMACFLEALPSLSVDV